MRSLRRVWRCAAPRLRLDTAASHLLFLPFIASCYAYARRTCAFRDTFAPSVDEQPPEREHQQYAEHGGHGQPEHHASEPRGSQHRLPSADDFADSTLRGGHCAMPRWVASSISRMNTRDHAHTTATHTIWITGQLQYITPGFSTGALPHASLTTPMITSPAGAEQHERGHSGDSQRDQRVFEPLRKPQPIPSSVGTRPDLTHQHGEHSTPAASSSTSMLACNATR